MNIVHVYAFCELEFLRNLLIWLSVPLLNLIKCTKYVISESDKTGTSMSFPYSFGI